MAHRRVDEAAVRGPEEEVVRLAGMARDVEILEPVAVQVPDPDAVHAERHRGSGDLDVHAPGVLDRALEVRIPLQGRSRRAPPSPRGTWWPPR